MTASRKKPAVTQTHRVIRAYPLVAVKLPLLCTHHQQRRLHLTSLQARSLILSVFLYKDSSKRITFSCIQLLYAKPLRSLSCCVTALSSLPSLQSTIHKFAGAVYRTPPHTPPTSSSHHSYNNKLLQSLLNSRDSISTSTSTSLLCFTFKSYETAKADGDSVTSRSGLEVPRDRYLAAS